MSRQGYELALRWFKRVACFVGLHSPKENIKSTRKGEIYVFEHLGWKCSNCVKPLK